MRLRIASLYMASMAIARDNDSVAVVMRTDGATGDAAGCCCRGCCTGLLERASLAAQAATLRDRARAGDGTSS